MSYNGADRTRWCTFAICHLYDWTMRACFAFTNARSWQGAAHRYVGTMLGDSPEVSASVGAQSAGDARKVASMSLREPPGAASGESIQTIS